MPVFEHRKERRSNIHQINKYIGDGNGRVPTFFWSAYVTKVEKTCESEQDGDRGHNGKGFRVELRDDILSLTAFPLRSFLLRKLDK